MLFGPYDNTRYPISTIRADVADILGDISNGDSILGDQAVIHDNLSGVLTLGNGFANGTKFDAICSLGDVISYNNVKTTDSAQTFYTTVRAHLSKTLLVSLGEMVYSSGTYVSCMVQQPCGPNGNWNSVTKYQCTGSMPKGVTFKQLVRLFDEGDYDGVRKLLPLYSWNSDLSYDYSLCYVKPSTGVFDSQTFKRVFMKTYPRADFVGDPESIFQDLTHNAVQDCQSVDVNGLAIIDDLLKIKRLLPPLPSSKKELLSPKYIANVFLWFKYGFQNTYRDVDAIVTAVKENTPKKGPIPYQTLRKSSSDVCRKDGRDVSREYHVKIRYSRYDSRIMDLVVGLDNLGALPNLERSWDLIPFSFVLDWFINISGLLSRLDDFTRYQYFDIWCVTKSRKHSYPIRVGTPFGALSAYGVVTRSVYERIVQTSLDLPPVQIPSTPGFNNFAEAAALAIARKR